MYKFFIFSAEFLHIISFKLADALASWGESEDVFDDQDRKNQNTG